MTDPAAAAQQLARALGIQQDLESTEDQLAEDRAQLEADPPDEPLLTAPADEAMLLFDREEVAEDLRRHKGQIRYHREKTRALAQRLERLDAELAEYGIQLEVNTQPDQGGHSGHDSGEGAGADRRPAA